jgi:hypothetical protein
MANATIRREVERTGHDMTATKLPAAPPASFSDSVTRLPGFPDELLRDLYSTSDAYAAEHGYDLDRIFADLKSRDKLSEVHHFRESE